MLPM